MSKKVEEYQSLLGDIKTAIQQARLRAVLAVNSELILLYWQTGKMIAERQKQEGWSAKVIPRLAIDLQHEFTNLKGFSERNLGYMLRFAQEYPESSILQQPVAKLDESPVILQQLVAKLPWGHNILLMEKVKDKDVRLWYAQQTIEKSWSRDLLLNAIKMDSYDHAKSQPKTHNFSNTLPEIRAIMPMKSLEALTTWVFWVLQNP